MSKRTMPRAPSLAKDWAIARPRPRAPPVMKATPGRIGAERWWDMIELRLCPLLLTVVVFCLLRCARLEGEPRNYNGQYSGSVVQTRSRNAITEASTLVEGLGDLALPPHIQDALITPRLTLFYESNSIETTMSLWRHEIVSPFLHTPHACTTSLASHLGYRERIQPVGMDFDEHRTRIGSAWLVMMEGLIRTQQCPRRW